MNLRVPEVVTLLILQYFKLLIFTVKPSFSYSSYGTITNPDESNEKPILLFVGNTNNKQLVDEIDSRLKIHNYVRGLFEKSFELKTRNSPNVPLKAITKTTTTTTTPLVFLNSTKFAIPLIKSTTTLATRLFNSSLTIHANKLTTKSYKAIQPLHFLNRTEIPREKLCAYSLSQVDGQQWNCKIQYSSENEVKKKIPLFCLCSYERDCSQNEKMHLSIQYAAQLEQENREKGVNRGADYQCENVLKARTKLKRWTCSVKRENLFRTTSPPLGPAPVTDHFGESEKQFRTKNDELYCDCFHKKKCKHTRIVDFYD